jgi:hypothetical protein
MNANCAALTARTVKRLGRLGRAFVFHAPLRVAWEAKIKTFKGVPNATNHETQSLFSRSSRCNTRRIDRSPKGGTTAAGVPRPAPSGRLGDMCEEDRQENALSLDRGFRLLSRYNTSAGEALYVITEADRSVTTILLPEEY